MMKIIKLNEEDLPKNYWSRLAMLEEILELTETENHHSNQKDAEIIDEIKRNYACYKCLKPINDKPFAAFFISDNKTTEKIGIHLNCERKGQKYLY